MVHFSLHYTERHQKHLYCILVKQTKWRKTKIVDEKTKQPINKPKIKNDIKI